MHAAFDRSTAQSSIAFTSTAGGNVPAAVVSASMSNLIGIVLTLLLVGLLLESHGGGRPWQSVVDIVLLLLLPFALGHLAWRWIGTFVDLHKPLLGFTDLGTILLAVYTAFYGVCGGRASLRGQELASGGGGWPRSGLRPDPLATAIALA